MVAGRQNPPKVGYWDSYFEFLVKGEKNRQSLVRSLSRRASSSKYWTLVLPGTRKRLLELKVNYLLGVISNSDGHLVELLRRVRLDDCFECVLDSARVGFRKPSLEIFKVATRTLNVNPEECVYVGDIYSTDYCPAKEIGMQAILLDRFGTYASAGLPVIRTIADLKVAVRRLDQH